MIEGSTLVEQNDVPDPRFAQVMSSSNAGNASPTDDNIGSSVHD
jgi:hypothetical protein